jgi:hypothetical protein
MALYAFDGTWNTPAIPTNVWRFREAYRKTSGNEPDPFYSEGVGTGRLGMIGHLLGGMYGAGARHRLRKAYRRLCENYAKGDTEIIVIGFSRGAAMALHFTNIIANYGVNDPNDRRRQFLRRDPWLGWQFRASYRPCDAHRDAPRRFVGVWDIVESFKIPLGPLKGLRRKRRMALPDSVQRVYHALAYDERRKKWRNTDAIAAETGDFGWDSDGRYNWFDDPPRVRQVWFRGLHSDVGGGSGDDRMADISLRWMVDVARWTGVRIDLAQLGALRPDPNADFARRFDPWLNAPRHATGGFDTTFFTVERLAVFHASVLERTRAPQAHTRWSGTRRLLHRKRWTEPPSDRPLPASVQSQLWTHVARNKGLTRAGVDYSNQDLNGRSSQMRTSRGRTYDMPILSARTSSMPTSRTRTCAAPTCIARNCVEPTLLEQT